MKRKVFLALALFTLMAAGVYAQTEADFAVQKSADGKSVTITRYKGTANDVKIPEKIQNLPVTSIGKQSFANSKITSVTIPDGVTSIGYGAFQDCKSLTSITIPDSVTSIGARAFQDCKSLTSITIPDSVTSSIEEMAFQGCTSLTSVTIGNGVTSIGKNAFSSCEKLTSVTIPNSVTSIEQMAFSRTGIASVTISASVKTLGSNAFGCGYLTSVTFQGTIPESGLHYAAFGYGNNSLGNIRDKYLAAGGGAGTYTRPDVRSTTWTKK